MYSFIPTLDTDLRQDVYYALTAVTGRAGLFIGTGMGKGVLGVKFIVDRLTENGRALVICPASLQYDWITKAAEYAGIKLVRWDKAKPGDKVRVISAPLLVKVTKKSGRRSRVNEIKEWGPTVVVVDELHYFSNYAALRTKGMLEATAEAEFTLGLSGTPHDGDDTQGLRTQLSFINHAALVQHGVADYKAWRKAFCIVEWKFGREEVVGTKNKTKLDALFADVPCVFDKGEDLKRAQVFEPVYFELTGKSRKMYALFEEKGSLLDAGIETLNDNVLTSRLRLQELRAGYSRDASHTLHLFGSDAVDTAVAAVLRVGEPMVLTYQYAPFGLALVDALKAQGLKVAHLNGDVTSQGKKQIETDFQAGHYDLVVGQSAAISEGWTYTRARYMLLAEVPAGLTQWDQILGRINRRGQDSTCTYILLIGTGTPDAENYEALKRREDYAAWVGRPTDSKQVNKDCYVNHKRGSRRKRRKET